MHRPFVITVAAPLACGQCGALAAAYTPQTIKSWLVPMELGATDLGRGAIQPGGTFFCTLEVPGANESLGQDSLETPEHL